MKNMQHEQTGAFISYSSIDGISEPLHLQHHLQSKGIDAFCDIERKQNNSSTISDVLKQRIREHSNFILLFTIASARRLIDYGNSKSLNDRADSLNYTYEELSIAQQYHKNVIPVCIEKCENDAEIKRLMRKLFCGCFSRNDSYSYIYLKPNQSIDSFYSDIYNRIAAADYIRHPDLSQVYWVGTRESDMPSLTNGTGFKGCIALFGEKNDKNKIIMCEADDNKRVDHNDSTDVQQDEFIINSVRQVLEEDTSAKFMFYNPSNVHRLKLAETFGAEHFLCLNDEDVLSTVNNKHKFRELVKDIVPLVPILERGRSDCDYDDLIEAKSRGEFDDNNNYPHSVESITYDEDLKFIMQAPVASGGEGTFILTKDNAMSVLAALDRKARYMVSVYYTRNIPVNMHAIIYSNKIIYSPGSIQLMREVSTENKLMYKGADFIAYHQIDYNLRSEFEQQVKKVAQKLKSIGYRGVCGIDAIIHDGRVNIMEVNGRFQASTELINRTLIQSGLKTIQEMNYEAFYSDELPDIEELSTNYNIAFSNYAYSYEGCSMHDAHIHTMAPHSKHVVEVQSDGYTTNIPDPYISQAYLYRLVFRENIASISEDGNVLINENICTPNKWLIKQVHVKNKLMVKIALLIQGIRIENSIYESLREATNNAVDLKIGSGEDFMIINSPTNIRYVEFSPFSLNPSDDYPDKFSIYYYNKLLIDNVGIFPADQNQQRELSDHKHVFSEIAYLSTDRLRVHLTNACCLKLHKPNGEGCKFCNIEVNNNPNPIRIEDIQEVVNKYIEDSRAITENADPDDKPITLRHFLIGGQSLDNCDQMLIDTAKILKPTLKSVYVMTLPLSTSTVRELTELNVLEYAFNIEIFNAECRKKYMPGKSQIPLETYMTALKQTREILDGVQRRPKNKKVVRSMIIVGLEPYKDMISGIQSLIDNRIEPMLSVFRPLPNTPLEDLNAPTIRSVYELFLTVSRMLFEASSSKDKHEFRKLGPECIYCQNNTVSLPWSMQIGAKVERVWKIDKNKDKF